MIACFYKSAENIFKQICKHFVPEQRGSQSKAMK